MKKGTAIFPGWLFPFVYCVAGVDAYIIDHKLKQISETILKLKQQKKRLEYTAERSEVMESKAQEVMGLISAEDLDLTEYSDALVYRIIERITVLSKEEIRIRFVGGFEITQPLH